ncbi:hypothetical protein VC83_00417 [Pseudogymnoascus destructans]|uniref:Major facilitator superfamily (MFS) profile domain-containing protein n=1 Tax=Pseudogymnoascus destructans TaxID=655981 RepID=A0A177AM26_9PEZI|nr:uncharacterized protein VC83_00417 [Pseudogymnoascus destructans]OAF63119.2 hypothetical protein VC83_00417 [Pseudogymnoascus destructans]
MARVGLCVNIILPPAMAEIAYVIEAKEMKEPGGLVGSLWAGMIIDRSGWGTVTWTLGLLSAVTAIPAVAWMGGRLRMEEMRKWEDAEIPADTASC